jgi:AraC family ethanolamine operon transcriptional activator
VTTESPSNPDRSSQDSLPQSARFRAIEALNEFYAANGWASDYVQITPGSLRVDVGAKEVGNIALGREKVSHRVVGSAKSIDDQFSVLLSLNGSEALVSGRKLDRQNLLFITPNTDMDIVMNDGLDVVTIGIPADMFGEHLVAVGDDDSLLETQDIASLEIHNGHIEPLRRLTRDLFSGRSDGRSLDSIFVSRLIRAMVPKHAGTIKSDRYHRLSRHRIVERAREYIHDHLAEPILVPDLCSYCGASQRTLERMFKSDFGTTPNRYILAARLNAARRDLLNANFANFPIADIAMWNGFTHMGRFARHYENQFGQLPSADRKLVHKRH